MFSRTRYRGASQKEVGTTLRDAARRAQRPAWRDTATTIPVGARRQTEHTVVSHLSTAARTLLYQLSLTHPHRSLTALFELPRLPEHPIRTGVELDVP
jgi:hypothetical protein